ncbi:MAG: glycosyltransferase family 9 protein [Myxococcota bacterium]
METEEGKARASAKRAVGAGAEIERAYKIAVVKGGGLGDLIFALPAMEALHHAFPEAELVLLGAPWALSLFRDRPGVPHRVIPLPPSPGVRDHWEAEEDQPALENFFAAMQEESFDLALQLHGGGRFSNPFVSRLGARITAGCRTEDATGLDLTIPYVYWQSGTARWMEVVSLVGAPWTALEPALRVFPSDRTAAQAALPATDRPLVVLHPGAGDLRRRWPIDRFARIATSLCREGYLLALIGAQEEKDLGSAVMEAAGTTGGLLVDLTGALELPALVGLTARASLMIGNDSGPLHLAHAVGTRTVGLYWCGNIVTAAPPTRARHRPLLSWQLRCPSCGSHTVNERCEHTDSFVTEISESEVLAAAFDLLDRQPPST